MAGDAVGSTWTANLKKTDMSYLGALYSSISSLPYSQVLLLQSKWVTVWSYDIEVADRISASKIYSNLKHYFTNHLLKSLTQKITRARKLLFIPPVSLVGLQSSKKRSAIHITAPQPTAPSPPPAACNSRAKIGYKLLCC